MRNTSEMISELFRKNSAASTTTGALLANIFSLHLRSVIFSKDIYLSVALVSPRGARTDSSKSTHNEPPHGGNGGSTIRYSHLCEQTTAK